MNEHKLPPDIEKRFDEWWFAPRSQTTIMNWSGMFKEDSFIDFIFGTYQSANDKEQSLKEMIAYYVKRFFAEEIARLQSPD